MSIQIPRFYTQNKALNTICKNFRKCASGTRLDTIVNDFKVKDTNWGNVNRRPFVLHITYTIK